MFDPRSFHYPKFGEAPGAAGVVPAHDVGSRTSMELSLRPQATTEQGYGRRPGADGVLETVSR